MTGVEVTQADIDLAHRIVLEFHPGGWLAKEGEIAHAIARHRHEAEQAIAAQLQDPVTVHVNMLRGSIAKPAPSSLWHAYRRELFDAMPEEFRQEARSAALEAGKTNWDGLARSLMMAFDCDAKTPRAIFQHLKRCGEDIPQWLHDEAEMQNLDHTVSKGTRCVLIYRAMTEALSRSGGA